MKIDIITRCTRPEFLNEVLVSILSNRIPEIDLHWHIIFDTSVVKAVPTGALSSSQIPTTTYFWEGTPGDMAHTLINRVIDKLQMTKDPDHSYLERYVYILDDDNQIHPDFFSTIYENYSTHSVTECRGMIFSQYVGGKDFSKLEIREAKPENVKVRHIDMAQFLLSLDIIGDVRLQPGIYIADGYYIEEIYNARKENFIFIDKVLCNYNSLQSDKKDYFLPRVLMLGAEAELKSHKAYQFEDDSLKMEFASDENTIQKIAKFDPDCIITIGEDYTDFRSLCSSNHDIRQRWIHREAVDSNAGESAYNCSMMYILDPKTEDLVSVATPIYNTGEKLRRTYNSLCAQTHSNWEWVLVNDSTDTLTLSIAEDIASKDHRVKVYDFKQKSKGIIGDVKYKAFSLSRGSYIIELDHDDVLLPAAIEKTYAAFLEYPDAGFVYSDCAEIDENYNSLTYGDGFCFGYGSYREERHNGILFKVADTANINPLTIRHIVGVPNHLRAWRRDTYFKIGGHNRRLSIADDYELLVRTFLETKFVKIKECCYLQFYHGGNSQEAPRADIQRRVRTISNFYSDRIKARFEELGKEDWAHGNGWNSAPRRGEEENFVNYII
jgi:glycosyltransferase involved in cell wall biosynthesis